MSKRKPIAKISVTGLSVNDILNMDPEEFNKMNNADLKRIASRLVSASNKRIRRLEKTKGGQSSPAYLKYLKSGKKLFSVKGKTIGQVRKTLSQMKTFLNLKTSTVSGWKKIKRKIEKRLNIKDEETSKKVWEVYRKVQERDGGILKYVGGSTQVQKMVRDEVVENGADSEEVLNKVLSLIDMDYRKLIKKELEEIEEDDTDDIFSLEYEFDTDF